MRRLPDLLSFVALVASLWLLAAVPAQAHPGRTASDGCHYCRTNCSDWGVAWDQRHCHGGGSSGGGSTSGSGSSSGGSTSGGSGGASQPVAPADTTAPDSPKVSVTENGSAAPILEVAGEPGARVTVANGGSSAANGQLDAAGTATITLNLADGSYELAVTLRDAAGNTSAAKPTRVEVDGTSPGTPSLAVRPANTPNEYTSIEVAGEPGSKAVVTLAGPTRETLNGRLDASGVLLLEGLRVENGTWTVDAQLTDAGGNVSGLASDEFVVAVPAPDPADLITEVAGATVTVRATGPSDGSIHVLFDGAEQVDHTIELDENGEGTASVPLADGVWKLSSVTSDWRGEESDVARHESLTVDTSGPTLALAIDDEALKNGTLSWLVNLEDADARVEAVVLHEGVEVGKGSGLEGLLEGLATGDYTLRVTGADSFGNETVEEMLLSVAAPMSTAGAMTTLGLLAAFLFGTWRLIRTGWRRLRHRVVPVSD